MMAAEFPLTATTMFSLRFADPIPREAKNFLAQAWISQSRAVSFKVIVE